ncbi:uncharacterized protein LOC122352716 [Puntigrus tetrazona]|uniref:uncharacterized protein LOC122352716 n=1 Tax=Puntigrus tetrazona TaxID=1606681 RepID=UPI001C8A7A0D|nr:uncharacterized protein LOC122352716 [Puntigrus tetrazona]XP_043106208.1 uncharacterized protein LOC122352716 [Puntigrus tetrazona]
MCVFVYRSVTHADLIDMLLKWITNCLLFLSSIYLTHTDAENVFRAVEGETVHLPCPLLLNGSEQVSVDWTKYRTNSTIICKWSINSITESHGECIPRFKFNKTSFTLSVVNVQLSDSGNYSCKITRFIPPPILDSTSNMTLQVAVRPHLSLKKLNSSNETCVHLRCSLENLQPGQVNFTWDREGHGSLRSVLNNSMNSELLLCKPDWSDGDTITCYAKYLQTQTLYSCNITLDFRHKVAGVQLLIISCSAAAGLILCIITTVVICKCRKRDKNGSIVFSNKVYENFSFAMAHQNTQLNDKPQPEECVYEN